MSRRRPGEITHVANRRYDGAFRNLGYSIATFCGIIIDGKTRAAHTAKQSNCQACKDAMSARITKARSGQKHAPPERPAADASDTNRD